MKKTILSFALASLAFMPQAEAQKLDKNSLTFISFSAYPQCPIPFEYSTYALVDEHNTNLNGDITANYLGTGHYSRTYVTNGADVIIRYSGITDAVSPIEVVKEENINTFLIKKGYHPVKIKVKGGRFKAFGEKTVGFFVDVTTDAGVVYSDSLFRVQEWESPLFDNPKKAELYIDSCYAASADPKNNNAFNMKNVAASLNQIVCNQLGLTYLDSYRFHVYSVKPDKKSKYDYSDLIKAAETFEKAAKIIDKNDMKIAEFQAKANASLTTWQNAMANIDDPRLTAELKAAILYNIADYYVLSKDFEKANDFYTKAALAKSDFADTKKLIANAKVWAKAKERYEKMMAEFNAGK